MGATSAQIRAANPQISAHVSANAGTGKTHVLTQRVLRLLLAGVAAGRIVCLTYTRTAAAEMSERITSTLQKWAVMENAQLEAELVSISNTKPTDAELLLARQLFPAVLNSMPPPRIQTIHSFCQEILARFPLEAGLMPYFSVVDDVTAKELMLEAKQRLLHKQGDVKLCAAIEYVAANSSEKWFDEMLREVISGRNKFREFFENAVVVTGEEYIDFSLFEEGFLDFNESEFEQIVAAWKSNLSITHLKRLADVEVFLREKTPQSYAEIFCKTTGESYGLSSFMASAQLKKQPELEQIIAAEMERIQQIKEQVRKAKTYNLTLAAKQIAKAYIKIYDELKALQNVLDYEDLVFYTKRLFQKSDSASWILYKLDASIDHILVDEAQDASPSQWAIIERIAAEFFAGETAQDSNRSLFIVGDEKQSIYSFQGAKPANLSKISESFRLAASNAEKEWHKIPLDLSFRSVATIMQFVDAVFNRPEIKASVAFSSDEIVHQAHRSGNGLVELWPLVEHEEYEEQGNWELPIVAFKAFNADVELAEKIASTIKKWLDDGRVLANYGRAVEPADIIILLRKRGKLADVLVRKLKEKGIPVAGSDRLKLNEHIAIQDLVALAEFCLLPQDNLALACVLKSPIFGISENQLFELAYDRGGAALIDVIKNNSKYSWLAEELVVLQEVFATLSPYEFYNYLINNQNCRAKFLQRMGEEVNDPLDEFLDLAMQYESKHSRSMQNFVHWFKSSDYEIKRDMEARSSEVRVMTVHAAKGLQAPIVFLPDTTGQILSSNKQAKIQWFNDESFWAVDGKGNASAEVVELMEQSKEAEKAEYLRLLYVASTRAADELYVCGIQPKRENKNEQNWYKIIQATLEEIGKKNGDVLSYGELEIGAQKAVSAQPKAQVELPAFLSQKLPVQPAPIAVPAKATNFVAINLGIKIHKFFEHYKASRANIAAELAYEYLREPHLVEHVLQVIAEPEFAEIFAENALAEVAIATSDGVIKIDRLILTEKTALIVDFKTGQKQGHVMPEAYQQQMQKYAAVVQKLYPERKIAAKILWSFTPELQDVALT